MRGMDIIQWCEEYLAIVTNQGLFPHRGLWWGSLCVCRHGLPFLAPAAVMGRGGEGMV